MKGDKINKLYLSLLQKYGKPKGQWKLWCKRPKTMAEKEEIFIGAVLTQRTNWKNVEIAVSQLKKARAGSLKSIYHLSKNNIQRLAGLIKSSGFYNQKSYYLSGLAQFVLKEYGSLQKMGKQEAGKLRRELLNLKGIGPETADSILLYGLEKPVFVIDEYTKRLIRSERVSKNLTYDYLQNLFEDNLPQNYELFQDFHALIVIDGKQADK